MVARTATIGSLNNISCLLQDMDCKGRLSTWPQGGEAVRGRGRQCLQEQLPLAHSTASAAFSRIRTAMVGSVLGHEEER
jgi:hypothetical protein